jgi:hypothetical protein
LIITLVFHSRACSAPISGGKYWVRMAIRIVACHLHGYLPFAP